MYNSFIDDLYAFINCSLQIQIKFLNDALQHYVPSHNSNVVLYVSNVIGAIILLWE